MMFKNPLMLATRAAGGRPTRARSKWFAGQLVILLQIEGQGQFQAHTHQFRPPDQDGPEGRDGLVQERKPLLVCKP